MLNTSESVVRSQLRRKGYRLLKNRARNPERPDYGLYLIVAARSGFVVAGGTPWNFSLYLEEAESCAAELPRIRE